MPPHIPATDEQTPTTKEWAFLAGNGGSWVRMVMMARVGGRVVVRVRSAPRFATTAAGPLLRRDVHFALENDGWNCTFECEVHVSASEGARRGRRPALKGYSAGSWRCSPAWTTYVPLDHLNAVGPPGSRNTVVQRNASGPTARKWSEQERAAMNPPAIPRPAAPHPHHRPPNNLPGQAHLASRRPGLSRRPRPSSC